MLWQERPVDTLRDYIEKNIGDTVVVDVWLMISQGALWGLQNRYGSRKLGL